MQARMEAPRQVKALAELCEQLLARDRPMQFADTRCSRQSDQLNFETVVFHCLGCAWWGWPRAMPRTSIPPTNNILLYKCQECETVIVHVHWIDQQTNMVRPATHR